MEPTQKRQRSEEGQPNGGAANADGAANAECRLRIIAVNDVYLLDNLPKLSSLVESLRLEGHGKTLTVLSGDFVAPSLLSTVDAGAGMIEALKSVPIDIVCFGNHESDIGHAQLSARIAEFTNGGGLWINTNMPN